MTKVEFLNIKDFLVSINMATFITLDLLFVNFLCNLEMDKMCIL